MMEEENLLEPNSTAYPLLLSNGTVITKNQFQNWKREADDGPNVDKKKQLFALQALAECCYRGIYVPQDNKEAAVYTKKAAELGDPNAQYNISVCYAAGQGVEIDEDIFEMWCRKAAEQGHSAAQYHHFFYEYHMVRIARPITRKEKL